MGEKLKIVGLLRFSVLTPTYYSEKFGTLEKIAEHIFSPERMELRFRLFEALCLPSLTRQSDDNFDCVILTAESMPAPYLEHLQGLLAPYPNLHLRPVGTDTHYQLLKQGYNSVPVQGATHRALFRLDDDDCVDLDFIARTRRLAQGLMALQGYETPFILAHNRGFYVRFQEGENEIFDACERAPLSAGTTLVAPADYPANPYRFNHRALAQHYNTFSDISVPAFVRTIHGDNKSNPTQMGLTHKLRPRVVEKQIKAHFGLSPKLLRSL
ncbi:MAG TPA: hypothetical protein DEA05_07600 [Rhodobacteraceae bacterium]|nr:hypothetical protein [Paracoccaceae bacterium]